MNRLAGIIVAAVGFLIAVLSILKFIPALTAGGMGLLFFGGLIIAFSFINGPEDDGTERMSTAATLGNMFFSPGEVFTNLRRHPRWLVALLVMGILSATYSNLFVSRIGAERIANFTTDKTLEISFIANNEEAKKGVEANRPQTIADMKDPFKRAGQSILGFSVSFILYSILALSYVHFCTRNGQQAQLPTSTFDLNLLISFCGYEICTEHLGLVP